MNSMTDKEYLLAILEELINIPSVSGCCEEALDVLEKRAGELGFSLTSDRRGNRYLEIKGKNDNEKHMLAAHIDTIGMMVRQILPDGSLRFARVGGPNPHTLEGDYVLVHTADGRTVPGIVYCDVSSVHAFPNAIGAPRDENNMRVLLNEDVRSAADTKALGISNGDRISIEPRYKRFENGYIMSRYLDNKASVAILMTAAKAVCDNGIVPENTVILAFTVGEEVFQSFHVPDGISEYVALDTPVAAPQFETTEHDVGLICMDKFGPYDAVLTEKLEKAALAVGVSPKKDVYGAGLNAYGTDANTARMSGTDTLFAALGPGVSALHSVERTHTDSLEKTLKLVISYITGQPEGCQNGGEVPNV